MMKYILYPLCCSFSVFPISNYIDQPSCESKQLRNEKKSFSYVFVILFRLCHVIFLYLCFVSVFRTMRTSGVEQLCEIVNGLQPLTVFTESFILDVSAGSEYVCGYFILLETISLSMRWWKDKFKSNKLLPLDLSFYYFIDN